MTIKLTLEEFCEKHDLPFARYKDLLRRTSRYPAIERPTWFKKDENGNYIYTNPELKRFVESADSVVKPRKTKASAVAPHQADQVLSCKAKLIALEKRVAALEKHMNPSSFVLGN